MANIPTAADADAVVDKIYQLDWQLNPVHIHEYISSLDVTLIRHPIVAITSALHYLENDDYRGAAAVIQKTDFHTAIDENGWILQEDIACLALLWDLTEVKRSFQFQKLISLLIDVENIYLNRAYEPSEKQSSENHRLNVIRISSENEFLNQGATAAGNQNGFFISDIRLRLEYIILFARSHLTEMGFFSWEEFRRKYKERYETIIAYLRNHGRPDLEGSFIFAMDMSKFFNSASDAIVFYTNYLKSIPAGHYSQKAGGLINVAGQRVSENPDLAALSLDEALALFLENNNETGQMACEFHRIRLFWDKTHSSAECLEQALSLANMFLQMGNRYWYILIANHALRIVANDKSLLTHYAPLKEALSDQLSRNDNSFAVRRLDIFEACDWSLYPVSADQARLRFEELLTNHYNELTPVLLSDVYTGLSRSYAALMELEKASEYSERYYDLSIRFEHFTIEHRSKARHNLAASRLVLLHTLLAKKNSRLRPASDSAPRDQKEHCCWKIATEEITALEDWIQIDIKHNFEQLLRDKRITHTRILEFLRNNFSEEINAGGIVLTSHGIIEDITFDHKIDLGDLLLLVKQGRTQQGVELTNQKLERLLNNPAAKVGSLISAYYICVLAYDAATWHPTVSKKLSDQKKEEYLEIQIRYLRKQRDLCEAIGAHNSLLQSAIPFQRYMQRYIRLHPALKSDLISEVEQYFQEAEKATEMYRKSVFRSNDISTLLRMRKVVSRNLTPLLYSSAISFYIAMKDLPMTWTWAQKGRARSLLDLIVQHDTSTNTLLSTLEKNPETRSLLDGETDLTKKVQRASTAEYLRAKTALQSQRLKLFAVPVLEELLGKPVTKDSFGYAEASAIYHHVKTWLPKGRNVILVNWVVESTGWICLLTMDCQNQEVKGRSRLSLRFSVVREWIEEYLTFPKDGRARLRRKHGALKQLTGLVEALSFMSQPEDLLALSPPAEFAAIPLHGIPIGVNGPLMIERNPVVYTSRFSLYLECVCRVEVCDALPDRSLSNAVFAAAYEEPRYGEERVKTFEKMEELSNGFDACHILGHKLTADTFKAALESSPWIHYHGHAYYETSEALNQCYVLSDGNEFSTAIMPLNSLTITPPSHAAQTSNDSGQDDLSPLLSGSSRLSVSDIFAMDLKKTKPFICSIACDSGVQDITEGDEPLGLITAFFCAGASSVLGTLWPIESETGRLFTTLFYDSLVKQIGEDSLEEPHFGRILNVARAAREAILAVKKVKRDPYSWASFVLHGAGFYRTAHRLRRQAQEGAPTEEHVVQ